MSVRTKLRAYGTLFARTRPRQAPELARLLRQRPLLLAAVGAYEFALLASDRVDARLKALASLKTAALVGCPF